MSTRTRPALRLLLVVGVDLAALVILHGLGSREWLQVDWNHLARWAVDVPPEDAVVAVARLLGLVGAYWILASIALCFLARASHAPALLSGVRWLAMPGSGASSTAPWR